MVFVGPSGCGKSTLLRMIAGLEAVSAGAITIGERLVNNLPPAERDIAMVFQSYALYPHKTVAANMAFALKLRKTDPTVVKERVQKAAEVLGVEAKGHHLPVGAECGVGDGQPVLYGIRPEHLGLADDGFPARVAVVEPTGAETILFLRFGENDVVAVLRDWYDFKPGQTVRLGPRADKAHLFDSTTGARISARVTS